MRADPEPRLTARPGILLHPFADRPLRRREGCDAFLDRHRAELAARGWHVVDAPCSGPGDYEDALRSVWGHGAPILVLEHDVVPTLAMIDALAACRHGLCAQAYRLYPATTGLCAPVFAHRRHTVATGSRWIAQGERWADCASLGLSRIGVEAQRRAPPSSWGIGDWHTLDTRIAQALFLASLPAWRYTGERPTALLSHGIEARPGDVVRSERPIDHIAFVPVRCRRLRWHLHWPEADHRHAETEED